MTNIVVIVLLVLLTGILGYQIYQKVKERDVTTEDIDGFKRWLVYACAVAQKEIGKDTGELKLYKVYDMAVEKYPWIVDFITFDKFKELVDGAKKELLELGEDNEKIIEFLYGIIPEKELNDGE